MPGDLGAIEAPFLDSTTCIANYPILTWTPLIRFQAGLKFTLSKHGGDVADCHTSLALEYVGPLPKTH